MKISVLSILFFCLLSSCVKKGIVVSNNFECTINGENWKPQAPVNNYIVGMFGANRQVALKCTYSEYNNVNGISIEANRFRKQDTSYMVSSIIINLPNLTTGATYNLTNISGSIAGKPSMSFFSESNCYYSNYDQNNNVAGTVSISQFSISERKVSGKFSFQMVNPCGNVSISQGSFNTSFQ